MRRFGRVAVSWMVTLGVLGMVVAIMLFFIWLEDNKKAVYAKLMWQGWPRWLLGSQVRGNGRAIACWLLAQHEMV